MPEMTRIPEIHESPGHPLGEFWAPIRQHRNHIRRLRTIGPAKSRALLTIVHNEAVLFPVWLRYYSQFFGPDDIYVIDNGSTDGSTAGHGFVRIDDSNEVFDNYWILNTVERYQHELIERYDVVLVTDVDEIVTPVPGWGTLGDYIDEFAEEYVNCVGYEIVHLKDREPPLDPARPILAQRSYWYAHDGYDKPSLASVPMKWKPGFHQREDEGFNWDPDLRLIHLHRVDYDLCLARHRKWRSFEWPEKDLEEGLGTHNRVTDEEGDFQRWFYEDSGFEEQGIHIVLERIPESWQGQF
jgi:hypothetical protein